MKKSRRERGNLTFGLLCAPLCLCLCQHTRWTQKLIFLPCSLIIISFLVILLLATTHSWHDALRWFHLLLFYNHFFLLTGRGGVCQGILQLFEGFGTWLPLAKDWPQLIIVCLQLPLKSVDTLTKTLTCLEEGPQSDSGVDKSNDFATASIWMLTSANPKVQKEKQEPTKHDPVKRFHFLSCLLLLLCFCPTPCHCCCMMHCWQSTFPFWALLC